jgi:hypothetical protein
MGFAVSRNGAENFMNKLDTFDAPDRNAENAQDAQIPAAPQATAPRQRAVGAPLSTGRNRHASYSSAEARVNRLAAPPPGRALGNAPAAAGEASSLQRAAAMLRSALPFVQRLLPLLDGNIATTVSSLLAPRAHQQTQSSAKLDLVPIEDSLADLQMQHEKLRDQVTEQNNSLKRVEDQLEMVREATDRNTLEQQELLEELMTFRKNIKIVAIVALVLVVAGFSMMLVLFMHIQRVRP